MDLAPFGNKLFNVLYAEAPEVQITDIRIDDGTFGFPLPTRQGYVSFDGLASDWVRVCYEGDQHIWGDYEARILCRQSQYSDGTATRIDEHPDGVESMWILEDFNCDTGIYVSLHVFRRFYLESRVVNLREI